MSNAALRWDSIPGTYIFDGEAAMKGYALNKMCYSFNSAANREEFLKDEDAYCTKFDLNDEQRKAIKEMSVLGCIRAGSTTWRSSLVFPLERAGRRSAADRHDSG